jgi:hypothetical protein
MVWSKESKIEQTKKKKKNLNQILKKVSYSSSLGTIFVVVLNDGIRY